MAFFPRSFISHRPSSSPHSDNSTSSFHPLFRLLDDFDQYSRSAADTSNGIFGGQSSIMKSFTPKFDVKETSDTYELHGELPGIDQQNISIEFIDAETLNVKGKVERSYTSGTPPATLESGSTPATIKDKAHQPTVEDESSAAKTNGAAESSTTVATKDNNNNEVASKQKAPKDKFWVSERSVGEFSRSFTFPARVDQDAVTASMKNGILSVVVPKAKKVDYRKITIN